MGFLPIAQYMNEHEERERNRNDYNRVYDDWTSIQIKHILQNITYTGRIAYGRTKKVYSNNNRNSSREKQSDYIISDKTFEAIIDDDTFYKAQEKLKEKT